MSQPTLRLFFALWPDPVTRGAIAALASAVGRETGGRAVAAEQVHLTLAFLGEQPAASVPELCGLAAAIGISAFRLALDQIGCFYKTGIAWLGTSVLPSELVTLHGGLARTLADVGIAVDERAYAPHLTLARRITRSVRRRLPQPVLWDVDSYALVASELDRKGARYRVVDAWPGRVSA